MTKRDNTFVLGVPQAHELSMALDRCDWTAADVTKLSTGNLATLVKDFMNGKFGFKHQLHFPEHDPSPSIVVDGKPQQYPKPLPPEFEFDPKMLSLMQIGGIRGNGLNGRVLREQLTLFPYISLLTLEMRGYLLENTFFIPKEWKNGAKIYFMGSVKMLQGKDGRPFTFEMWWSKKSKDWFSGPVPCDEGMHFDPGDFLAYI